MRAFVQWFALPAASAIATAFVKPVGETIRSAPNWIRARLACDHTTIQNHQFQNDQGGRSRIYANVVLAPGKSFKAQRLPDIRETKQWIAHSFPEFALDLAYADLSTQIRFEEKPVSPEQLDKAAVILSSNGRMEITLPVRHEMYDEKLTIKVVEPAKRIHQMLVAMLNGHRDLFGRGRFIPRCGLDARVSMSSGISTPKGLEAWNELRFPGRAPHPKPAGQRAFPHECAADRLSVRNAHLASVRVVRTFLEELCGNNGYSDYEGPIDDVLAVIA